MIHPPSLNNGMHADLDLEARSLHQLVIASRPVLIVKQVQ